MKNEGSVEAQNEVIKGNQKFSEYDYEKAIEHYRKATELSPS